MPDSNIKEDALTKPGPLDAVTNRQLLAAIRKARRNTYGDPMYHSGRKKKEFASPYLEFLAMPEKATRKMPQPTSSTPGTQTGSGTRIWTQGNGS